MEKAIILVGISSGLSSNEIINLKVGNFKDGYDSTTGITTLKLRRGKTSVDFITFLTPEAIQAVIDYLEFRERKSDSTDVRKQNQLKKQHVSSNNDYLFLAYTYNVLMCDWRILHFILYVSKFSNKWPYINCRVL